MLMAAWGGFVEDTKADRASKMLSKMRAVDVEEAYGILIDGL